jgi:predicted esterase
MVQKEVSPAEKQAAANKLQRAFSLHTAGQTPKALKLFLRALELNPELVEDQFAENLVKELTGLSPEQAIQSLQNPETRTALEDSLQSRSSQPRRQVRPLSVVLLVLALAALAFVSYRFIQLGYVDRYRALIARQLGNINQQRVGGYGYHLLKPLGNPPPEGWPVVVALHGFGGQGSDMLSIASQFTSQGIVYIAPSFGEYQPYPGNGPIDPLRLILEDAAAQVPLNQNKVVLLGFSQGGTFAYRFSLYHPEWVSGVVTAGAPDFDSGAPVRGNIRYVFTWGELDGLADLVLPKSVYPLINQGYNVQYQIIPGAGHEVTPYAIDTAIALTKP